MSERLKVRLEPYFSAAAPCIILSIITIVLNIFVINFYRKKKTSLVPLLYSMIAGADILTGLGVIHQSISISLFTRYIISESTLDSNTVVCYTLTQLSYRSSVFYNLVLAVSRTVMILRPFHRINTKTVLLVCVLYVIPWIVIAGIDIHEFQVVDGTFTRASYFDWVLMGAGMTRMIDRHGVQHSIWWWYGIPFIILLLPFVIPVIIIIITCIIQVVSLNKPSQFQASSNQRHVTITIILLSTLFVICNSGLYGYFFPLMFGANGSEASFDIGVAIFGTVLPILNSALNPVIIISRSKDLREEFARKMRRVKMSTVTETRVED